LLRYFTILLILAAAGCFSPLKKNDKVAEKVEKAKANIESNTEKRNEIAKSYLFGASYALRLDPNPSIYSTVAEGYVDRTLAITGNPNLEETGTIKKITDGLVSTNAATVKAAEKELKKKDDEVIALEHKLEILETKLAKTEEKAKEVAAENAQYANTWYKIKRVFYWIAIIFVAGFILQILSQVLPPPYSSVFGVFAFVFGAFGKLIMGIIPAAKTFAGVVSKETHEAYSSTLASLVNSIQQIKKENPDFFKDKVAPVLRDKTSVVDREIIVDVKKQLGHL